MVQLRMEISAELIPTSLSNFSKEHGTVFGKFYKAKCVHLSSSSILAKISPEITDSFVVGTMSNFVLTRDKSTVGIVEVSILQIDETPLTTIFNISNKRHLNYNTRQWLNIPLLFFQIFFNFN